MKFTDGNWLIKKGVKPHYAAQAFEVEDCGSSLTVIAPCKVIRHRGDTLDGPNLTIKYWSPMADVIGVRVAHFDGAFDHGPNFDLDLARTQPQITTGEHEGTFTSGNLTVKVSGQDTWKAEFVAGDKLITRSHGKSLGYCEVEGEGAFLHEQLHLGVGECVYGLGERFSAFVKNGQVVDMWNKDGGTGCEQAYKNVPFYMTNRGYGVFVNNSSDVSFEVASEKVACTQFSVKGEVLEYFVIYGPTPKEVLDKYTALTGRPALPPAWTFGLWLTTSFTTSYDEATVTQFIEGFEKRDIPLHVFHFDCFWMRQHRWCDFQWDPVAFPDPPGILKRLKDRGLHVCAWINPYVGQRSVLFEEGKAGGYFIRKPNGDVWQTDQWQPGMAIVDFTNPDACEWFASKLRGLLDIGVDCFKTDFGERIPTEVKYHNGADPVRMHNYYTFLYNKVTFDTLKERRGEGEAALFARSATSGCQQFPIHWGGDCYSTFESMAETLRGGLSLGLSGFAFWSHDIGGFEGTPPADVYKRWVPFGLLSSHSRLHGSTSYRVPWVFDDEACDVLRFYTKLKCRLMPYLFAKAVEAKEKGTPLLRAMVLEFADDPGCDGLDRQFMLGDSLLVAPVMSAGGEVSFYLPKGKWTSLLTGEVVIGGSWQIQKHEFMSLPIYVRENTLLALGNNDKRPDYDYGQGLVLSLYQLQDGAKAVVSVPSTVGNIVLKAHASRKGSGVTLSSAVPVLLVNVKEVSNLLGATSEVTPAGLLLTPQTDATVTFNVK